MARQAVNAHGVPITVDTIDMVRRVGRDGYLLAVRSALAPLNAARASRLPAGARRYHDHITATVRFSDGKLHVTP